VKGDGKNNFIGETFKFCGSCLGKSFSEQLGRLKSGDGGHGRAGLELGLCDGVKDVSLAEDSSI
jgi:hypothetical protein